MNETHTLWPVSYVDDDGIQQNCLYSFDPSRVAPEKYWVGDAITLIAEHPSNMSENHRAAKILEMRKKLAALESGASQ